MLKSNEAYCSVKMQWASVCLGAAAENQTFKKQF